MKLFISYRRDDARHLTDRIYDRLVTQFGKAAVFKDVDAIPLGVDFRGHLTESVAQCDVVLVVIGRNWLSVRDASGRRRLDDENDLVRAEIELALQDGV